MFSHHLAIAAAREAVDNQKKAQPKASHRIVANGRAPSSTLGPTASPLVPASRTFSSAFPGKQSDFALKPGISTASSSAREIQIPQFLINSLEWDPPGAEFPADQETTEVRTKVMQTLNDCLTKQNAASTICTYEAILNKEVGEAQRQLDMLLLPLDSESKFLALSGFVKLNSPDLKWSRVQALKSALKKYHSRQNESCVFDHWTPVMQALWTGLSRSAKHSTQGKEPIEFPVVMAHLSDTAKDENPATLRFRAMAVVGFFGVRRCAEVLAFTISDVSNASNGDFHLLVKCQKNDQAGIGMHCVIPAVDSLGPNSPARVLGKWLALRPAVARTDGADEPLFCTVAGAAKSIGNRVSADSFRKAVYANFPGNTATHSLRKGGARFYAAAEAPEQATRDQGGWRTTETMREIYTSLTPSEVKCALHKAANTAGDTYALQTLANYIQAPGFASRDGDIKLAIDFITRVDSSIGYTPWKILIELRIGVHLRRLAQHADPEVRIKATPTLCHLRAAWATHKAESRK